MPYDTISICAKCHETQYIVLYAIWRKYRRVNTRNTQCMDACPALFKRGAYNFRLPPLKVRDLRLDLGKNP